MHAPLEKPAPGSPARSMETPQRTSLRDSTAFRVGYLIFFYSILIATSPWLALPRWLGASGLGFGLALLLIWPQQTRLNPINPKQITLPQALFLLDLVFPFCVSYYAIDQKFLH